MCRDHSPKKNDCADGNAAIVYYHNSGRPHLTSVFGRLLHFSYGSLIIGVLKRILGTWMVSEFITRS
jgi:hypothetical protein